jgi:hypothetical protein
LEAATLAGVARFVTNWLQLFEAVGANRSGSYLATVAISPNEFSCRFAFSSQSGEKQRQSKNQKAGI